MEGPLVRAPYLPVSDGESKRFAWSSVLAFFTVVASSPNLSTFFKSPAKVRLFFGFKYMKRKIFLFLFSFLQESRRFLDVFRTESAPEAVMPFAVIAGELYQGL